MVTDSFITQAEEALAKYEETRNLGVHAPRTKVAAIADQQHNALRSLLGEYKRLTTEQEWEYGSALRSENGEIWDAWPSTLTQAQRDVAEDVFDDHAPDELIIVKRTPERTAGPWVPVEGEDQ